jgi:RNA polymerase sigma factor (sigma-70 family)
LTFQEIYDLHKDLVFNLALQYVQNYEDAEEITQDVFVMVYKSLETFRFESKYSTWLYKITINKSLDFIKSKNRKKRLGFIQSLFHEDTNEIKHDIPNFDHPGVQLEQREAIKNIFYHINQLPDNQRTVLILSKIEQKSQKEIAEILDISPKAVESLFQRAKSNLQNKMQSAEGNN